MKIDKTSAALGAAAAIVVGAGAITYATVAKADPTPSPSAGSSATTPRSGDERAPRQHNETPLTGDTAAKVKAAVLKKYPGATIHRLETEDPAEGTNAPYEAHITTTDGKNLRVLLDKNFAIVRADEDRRGGHGRGGPGGHNETPLTGDTATKVKAAVLKRYPGATIHRLETEDPAEGTGGVYEAHITTTDGKHLRVLLNKSFAITGADEDKRGGPGGPHGGPPPAGTPSNGSTPGATSESSYSA